MATAKKAATKTTPKTEGTKYTWSARPAYSGSLSDDAMWEIGSHVSLESAVNSDDFSNFMQHNDNPERVYLIAVTSDGKPHRFHRIQVKQAGYTFKEG